jgi:serine/threonine protein phosphatase PrpC
MSGWDSAGATDTGLLREANEDRYWVDAAHGVFLVVDGVGGEAAGELAAQTAVDAVRETILEGGDPEARVRRAIAHANNSIFDAAQQTPGLKGMACVLTLAVVEAGEVTIGHVGDSRLYLIWNGSIRKLTSDHSPVGEAEDAGALTEAEAMLDPRRNQVFRDVGSRRRSPEDAGFIDIRKCRFRPDAALLLCSDGLTDHLTAQQVREIVEDYDGDAARIAAELVEAANGAGGRDNITALLVAGAEFGARGRAARTTRPRGARTRARDARWFKSRLALMAYGLLLGMLVWVVMRIRG